VVVKEKAKNESAPPGINIRQRDEIRRDDGATFADRRGKSCGIVEGLGIGPGIGVVSDIHSGRTAWGTASA
jgi:hypothetical protein